MTTSPDADRGASSDAAGASPAPVPEKASLFEDFIDIFYAPSTVFARREQASSWPYILIITVVSAGFLFASRSIMSAVMDAEFTRNMARAMAKNSQLTEEMVASQRKMMEGFSNIGMYFAMPIVIVLAAVLIWIGAKVMGAKLSFDRAMLISAIAQIPRLLGALFTTVQGILMNDTSTITSKHAVGYSPARFLDPSTMQPQLLELISRFDIFTLWVTVLLGIGVAVIAKVPRNRGLAAGAVAWGIASLLTVVSLLWA